MAKEKSIAIVPFDRYIALDDEINDFIVYIAEHTKHNTNHTMGIVVLQMMTKIFAKIQDLEDKQIWLDEQLLSLTSPSISPTIH